MSQISLMEFECGPIYFSAPDGRVILDGITLIFSPPMLCVINGRSGVGKSTLLRAISGLNGAKVGKRRLGAQSYGDGDLPRWRSRVTLISQDAPCIQGTVFENLAFPFSLKNAKKKVFPRQRAIELLERTGLGHLEMELDVGKLSGGERHRLSLVRGILWAPPVLLADEPLGGLDHKRARECLMLLKEFSRSRPAVVIVVLHEEGLTKEADICLRLEDGKLH